MKNPEESVSSSDKSKHNKPSKAAKLSFKWRGKRRGPNRKGKNKQQGTHNPDYVRTQKLMDELSKNYTSLTGKPIDGMRKPDHVKTQSLLAQLSKL